MTRDEIDDALKRIVAEAGAVAKNPLAREARLVAGAVALLAVIVGEQEQRLRAVEPCPGAPKAYNDKSHAWDGDRCARCRARRTT